MLLRKNSLSKVRVTSDIVHIGVQQESLVVSDQTQVQLNFFQYHFLFPV